MAKSKSEVKRVGRFEQSGPRNGGGNGGAAKPIAQEPGASYGGGGGGDAFGARGPNLSAAGLAAARAAMDAAWKWPVTRDDLVRAIVSGYLAAVEKEKA